MCQVDEHFTNGRLGSLDLLDLGRDAPRVVVDQGFMPRGYLD